MMAVTTDLNGSKTQVLAVQVRWQKSDLSLFETQPSIAGITTPQTLSGVSISSSSGTSTVSVSMHTNCGNNHCGLSSGAIAGTVIGAVLGTLMVLAAILLLCMRRRKRERAQKFSGEEGSRLDPILLPEVNTKNTAFGLAPEKEVFREGVGVPELEAHEQTVAQTVTHDPIISELDNHQSESYMLGNNTNTASERTMNNPQTLNELPSALVIGPDSGEKEVVVDKPIAHTEPLPGNTISSIAIAAPTADISDNTAIALNAGSNNQLADLLDRQSKLQARKKRLIELQQIETEEEELKAKIQQHIKEQQNK
jgi:hypothetical protein